MKIKTHHEHGLSRVELFCVVVATSLLLFFFLVIPCTGTALNNSLRRSKRIMCASNLKQISLGMRLFAHDHGDKFPWMISTKLGGSLESANSSLAFRHFLAASNELVTPKILICRADSSRTITSDFAQLSNSNLSYFVSIDTSPDATNSAPSILSGDRNILGGTPINDSLRVVRKSDKLSWSKEIHREAGNVALADGSVLQVDDSGLNRTVATMTNAAIRLAIP